MSGEIIAIITVGVALAGLNLASFRALRSEMRSGFGSLRSEMRSGFGSLRSEMGSENGSLRSELVAIRAEITALRERMAHLDGLLGGLREAISGRVGARS